MNSEEVMVRFLGCGDAFGSGGRLHTCFMVKAADQQFLIDCGASALSAMKQQHVDPAQINLILITHLHGDHFGGLPFLLLDAQFVQARTRPLVVAGPPGLGKRIQEALEVFFPGSSGITWQFPLEFVELPEQRETAFGAVCVVPYSVVHPSGAPAYALRVTCGDKVLAYSGDTEWTPTLIDVARGADLFICEAYFFDKQVPYHLDYTTLVRHKEQLDCQRLIVTHLSDDLLRRLPEVALEVAEDGKVVTL